MNLFHRNEGATVEAPTRRTVIPRYNVREEEKAFVVTAFVPGADRSSVETTVHGENLTVSARRAQSVPEEWTPLYRESSEADYRLVLELDRRVNRDGVKAELNHGVLTLTVPKAESFQPRRIEIAG